MAERGGRGLREGESASVYSRYGKDLRSARKDADVGKQEGDSCQLVQQELCRRCSRLQTGTMWMTDVCNAVVMNGNEW